MCQNILLSMMLFLIGSEGLINVKSTLWIVVFLDYKDMCLIALVSDYLYLMSDLPPLLSSCFLFFSVTFLAFFPSPFELGPMGLQSQTGQRLNNNNLGLCQHRIKFPMNLFEYLFLLVGKFSAFSFFIWLFYILFSTLSYYFVS